MTAPYLDALDALLDKAQAMGDANTRMGTHWDGCETVHQLCMIDRLCAALTAMLSYVRELERERDDAMYDVGQAADKAALAMRERCAQACEALKVNRPSDPLANAFDGACETCAAAVRALEP